MTESLMAGAGIPKKCLRMFLATASKTEIAFFELVEDIIKRLGQEGVISTVYVVGTLWGGVYTMIPRMSLEHLSLVVGPGCGDSGLILFL